jgi:hypothetical protein
LHVFRPFSSEYQVHFLYRFIIFNKSYAICIVIIINHFPSDVFKYSYQTLSGSSYHFSADLWYDCSCPLGECNTCYSSVRQAIILARYQVWLFGYIWFTFNVIPASFENQFAQLHAVHSKTSSMSLVLLKLWKAMSIL